MDKNELWKNKQNINEDVNISERGIELNSGRLVNFTIEPSNEKDYDIYLMTGNNVKGSDKK